MFNEINSNKKKKKICSRIQLLSNIFKFNDL